MQNLIAAVLLSFTLPVGGELYLSEDSVYAEYKPVDFTLSVFSDKLAGQAIDEYKQRMAKPEPAGEEFGVKAIEHQQIAEYTAVTVDHVKPALIAKLDAQGKVITVRGIEITRQVLIDLGDEQLVFTTWTKDEAQDIPSISDAIVQSIVVGQGGEAKALEFRLNGMPIDEASQVIGSDPLAEPVSVEVHAEE